LAESVKSSELVGWRAIIGSLDLNVILKLDDPVFVSTGDGAVVESNDAFQRIIGTTDGSSKIFEVWPELEPFWEPAKDVHHSGKQLRTDVVAGSSGGRERTFDVRLAVVDSEGTVLGICRDVSADRAREKDLEVRATVDQLTGAFNRAQLEVLLRQSIRSARRQKTEGSFLYLDIDNFKHFNDSQGHSAGDAVLKKVVEILTNNLRDSDVVGRLGGDEFGIILQGTGIDSAVRKATQLTEALSNETSSSGLGVVEVSIGAAPFPVEGWSVMNVIDHADDAMYAAKKNRRDRVRTTDRNLGSSSDD
jgi:diguanylate cyclase (GGDEF)-like protein